MTIARKQLIDVSVTRWYHCMSRCVRGASLLCDGTSDRKVWLENRIEELAQIFAIGVGGFSVMDNHLHLLLRLDPDVANGWSDDAVVRRWGRLCPPRDNKRQPLPVSEAWVQEARISAELAGILDRIGSSGESWQRRLEKLKNGRWFGRFFAAGGEKLREIASCLNVRRVINLAGCAAP